MRCWPHLCLRGLVSGTLLSCVKEHVSTGGDSELFPLARTPPPAIYISVVPDAWVVAGGRRFSRQRWLRHALITAQLSLAGCLSDTGIFRSMSAVSRPSLNRPNTICTTSPRLSRRRVPPSFACKSSTSCACLRHMFVLSVVLHGASFLAHTAALMHDSVTTNSVPSFVGSGAPHCHRHVTSTSAPTLPPERRVLDRTPPAACGPRPVDPFPVQLLACAPLLAWTFPAARCILDGGAFAERVACLLGMPMESR